jgi:hypothetical protein
MNAFRVVLVVVGLFIAGTGLLEAVVGPALLPGDQQATASVDSNYRFFAVSWMALGVALLMAVNKIEESTNVIRGVSAVVFAGGIVRIISLVVDGEPHMMIYALLAVELVAPPLLVLWHNRITSR